MGIQCTRRQWIRGAVAGAALGACSQHSVTVEASDVSWLDEVQRPPATLPADAPTLSPLLSDASGARISDLETWQMRRKQIQSAWSKILGLAKFNLQTTPSFKVLDEDTSDGVVRQRIEYEIEPDLTTQAYIVRPKVVSGSVPGVAVFHSTVNHSILQPAGLAKDTEKAFGMKLAKKGCVSICPRNFLWPDNEHIAADQETKKFQQRHPNVTGMAKMLYDSVVALNILSELPNVDRRRLGAVGHSLGAKEVLYLAAFDDRVKVTVSSEGGIGIKFSNWDAPWYLGPAVKDARFKHEHHELLGLIAPRPFLLVGGDSADGDKGWPFIEAALPVYRLFGGRPRLGQFNHRKGHAVPPIAEQRIDEWLETYL